MFFCPLYSGSSGNALFCQYGNTRLLIDAGKSGKTIEDALASIGADIRTISGVLITHEHSDEAGKDFWLGDIGVVPFSIPHDAADPVGFRLYGGNLSVSTATDLGYFSEDVYANVAGSTLVLLESNHDPDMLRANPRYNAALKARILGDHGHLSNEACSSALLRLINAGTGNVILGHLSGENNTPTLARKVSSDALAREGIRPGEDIRMEVALRDEVGSVYILKERT